jgi:hypothetical protein
MTALIIFFLALSVIWRNQRNVETTTTTTTTIIIIIIIIIIIMAL